MAEPDPDPKARVALPGDDAPPLAGKPWRRVKMAAWVAAGVLLVGLAAVGAGLTGQVVDRVTASSVAA